MKIGQPENAERSFKCPNCGNMVAATNQVMQCDVCGELLDVSENKMIQASNEEY